MSGKLQVEKLGKSYRQWGNEWCRIASWFSSSIKPKEEHWVLKDVNFSVNPGEAVAITGQNGAGKSTLLKLITGTTCQTQGTINLQGKIAAILELGMGFNPEMTGRQNAHHSAGLMGYSQAEINNIMPEIEAFAEIGEYFDQPIRTYSTGMQARVAFSVATAFKPDLLIVDEVLSVGDSYFQHKSFDRIRQFKSEGISILLVTHSMADIRNLCDRVILLDKGKVIKEGLPDEVLDYYNAFIAEKENSKLSIEQKRQKNGWLLTKSGSGEASLTTLHLLDAISKAEISAISVGQAVELKAKAIINIEIPQLIFGVMIRDKQGHVVWGTNTAHTHQVLENLKKDDSIDISVFFDCNLGPGSYSITIALSSSDTHLSDNYEWIDNKLVFDVVNINKEFFIGSTWLGAKFFINKGLKK